MYKRSTNNFKFNQKSLKRLEESLKVLQNLYKDDLLEVCLYGSYAKGTQNKYSSIDIIVVITQSNERFVKRNANVQRLLNETDEIPQIEPLIYTEDELKDLIKKKESFIISALGEAYVLWNGFNDINLAELTDSNGQPSRYFPATPKLKEVDL